VRGSRGALEALLEQGPCPEVEQRVRARLAFVRSVLHGNREKRRKRS
jgi:hypothetical protein